MYLFPIKNLPCAFIRSVLNSTVTAQPCVFINFGKIPCPVRLLDTPEYVCLPHSNPLLFYIIFQRGYSHWKSAIWISIWSSLLFHAWCVYEKWKRNCRVSTWKIPGMCSIMYSSCHIRSVLIGVKYWNCHQTLDVYLLFAIWVGQIE